MKSNYTINIDVITKELILTALMETAYNTNGQAKQNYLNAYKEIKRQIINN